MLSLDDYLREAEIAHGHLCAGQVLGVRLAMLGLKKLGIEDPRGKDRKRLVTFVEIDRCATDAIAVVTGCRLGKRALKFRDWGKMAATFVDLASPLARAPQTAGLSGSTPTTATKPYASPPKSRPKRWHAPCIPKSKTKTSSRCWPTAKWPKTTYSPSSG